LKFKEFFLRSVLPMIIAFVLYCTTGVIFIISLKSMFIIFVEVTVRYDFPVYLTALIFTVIVTILMFICYIRIAFYFYRLKENQNTKFLYGVFEIILGLFIMITFSVSFLPEPLSVFGIDAKVILGFYGGIYVIVRGLENCKKHFDYYKKDPVIFFLLNRRKSIEINFDRKTPIEKFFERMIKF
jgi:hypothetical protein